ncbi:B12-binding domain-containing radical SAM protein [Verrucomicrobiota bacterium]
MRICLVYPPTEFMIRTNVPSVVDEVTGFYPPLGLLYVAGAVEAGGRHEVSVIDCVAEGLAGSALETRIRAAAPDVVGIQAITFSIIDARNVACLVKRIGPGIPVVMGGPHANLFPEETLSLAEVDYVLLGEGENNIVPFLDALGRGRSDGSVRSDRSLLSDVPGIVFAGENGQIVHGPPNALIEDMDSLPMPSRHLLDQGRYSSVLARGKLMTTVMSSRGCPARCIFCDRPHLGKAFRARSAGNVAAELEQCVEKYGIDEFFFYDDTFTIDKQRVLDVCSAVRERKINVYWDIRARVANLDRELLEALRGAGCVRIHLGIESGNEEILKTIRKGVDLDKARQVFSWCRELGIETLAYFMFGFPGEGHAEVRDTIDYALSIDCDYVHAAATTPFPGTELYRRGLETGLYKSDYWKEFAESPTPGFVPELWTEQLSREEIVGYMFELYRRFYRRPSYVLRRLASVRSPRQLLKYARAGVRILGARKE